MEKPNRFTRILAYAGTALVWFPVLAPFLLSAARLIQAHRLRFDFLIPGELFPVVLVGGGLLLWAALRARSQRGVIAGALGAAVAFLVASQGAAVATGLASGEMERSGPWFVLIVALYASFCAAVLVLGVGGVLLLRDLLGRKKSQGTSR